MEETILNLLVSALRVSMACTDALQEGTLVPENNLAAKDLPPKEVLIDYWNWKEWGFSHRKNRATVEIEDVLRELKGGDPEAVVDIDWVPASEYLAKITRTF